MAKVSMINREEKRKRLAARDGAKREALREKIKNASSYEEQQEAIFALNKLPRDGARIRQRNRCAFTGRPHGFHRKFGISRIMLRKMGNEGLIPGLRKASW